MSTAAIDPDIEQAPPTIVNLGGSRLERLSQWMRDPLAVLERGRDADILVVDLGAQRAWHLYQPRHIERVLVRNAENYTKDTRGYRAMRVALGQGLLTSQGDLWRRQRRIANPAFHRKSIAAMADTMAECTRDLADDWASSAASGQSRDVAEDMTQLTLRIACRAFFSVDVHGGEAHRIGEATADIVKQFLFHMSFPFPWPERLPTPGNWRYWRALKVLNEVVYGLVAERRASTERPHDLLSMFLEAVDEETGEGMSDEALRDELVTMMAAGHETTANALAWALHLLAENPDVAARARAELAEVVGDRQVTGADVHNLPYLDRVFKESLRLYPPAWVHARRAAEDDSFEGITIPKGTFTVLPMWAVHRDPRWWDEPTRFDPDRFLPERSEDRPKFAYFPFSGGRRKCIGDRFAQMEALIILGTLLPRYDLKSTPGHPIVPEPGVTLRPKHGIALDLSALD